MQKRRPPGSSITGSMRTASVGQQQSLFAPCNAEHLTWQEVFDFGGQANLLLFCFCGGCEMCSCQICSLALVSEGDSLFGRTSYVRKKCNLPPMLPCYLIWMGICFSFDGKFCLKGKHLSLLVKLDSLSLSKKRRKFTCVLSNIRSVKQRRNNFEQLPQATTPARQFCHYTENYRPMGKEDVQDLSISLHSSFWALLIPSTILAFFENMQKNAALGVKI